MKTLLILALIMLSCQAQAQDTDYHLETALTSYHFNRTKGFNENNFGLGETKNSWAVGYYNNSNRKYSTYALHSTLYGDSIKYGIVVGVVTGYTIAPIAPMAGVQIIIPINKFALNLIAVPTIKNKVHGFIGVQIRY